MGPPPHREGSPSFISQLERSQTNASIPTLLRITGALNVSTGRLLSDESRVMRPERAIDRQPLVYGDYRGYVLTRRPPHTSTRFPIERHPAPVV